MLTTKPTDVNSYIASFPTAIQKRMEQIRAIVRKVAPQAEEVISYQMPAYKLQGMLVYFAAYEHHIGLYPMASGIKAFQKELAVFKNAKGSVQFPHKKPFPTDLIRRMVAFRVKENLEKAAQKQEGKTKNDLPTTLNVPAQRALAQQKITTLKKLSAFREVELLALHGIGPSVITELRQALINKGLSFKK